MCTVTIFPKGKSDFILTSNRDESPSRISSIPQFYEVNSMKLLFPKDERSGGTWIGVSEKNRVVCMMNGGFARHERQLEYRLSRGLVTKDYLISDSITKSLNDYDLVGIEPFTMVVADWNDALRFFELVWDGVQKHVAELPLEAKIWSSSTLYSEAMKQERQHWFDDFKVQNELSAPSFLKFHKTAGMGNDYYGVVMDRGFVKTTSITQVEKCDLAIKMHYENLHNKKVSDAVFDLPQTIND